MNSRMPRSASIDLKGPSSRKLTTESQNLMSNLAKPRRSSPDCRISSTVRCRPELREKRTSCKKSTTRNTNWTRRSTRKELTNHWSWVNSKTIATSSSRCSISILRSSRRRQWPNSWGWERPWKLKWMRDSTSRTKSSIVCRRASRHSRTLCKLWVRLCVEEDTRNNITH